MLKELNNGRRFLTERDEITVRYEIGIALDGQRKLDKAVDEFIFVRDKSPSDSYYAMGASYEVPRLKLDLWLSNPTAENYPSLEAAANGFRIWLARDWNKLTTKLWGYYHGVCLYRQKQKFLQQRGQNLENPEQQLLDSYLSNFQATARAQKGVRRYELRFSAFFLTGKNYERFPGEPLRCDIDDILAEFKVY